MSAIGKLKNRLRISIRGAALASIFTIAVTTVIFLHSDRALADPSWKAAWTYGDHNLWYPGPSAVDAQENCYVSGALHGSTRLGDIDVSGSGFFVAKRSRTGAWLWAAKVDAPPGSPYVQKIVIDNDGNLYVAGSKGNVTSTFVGLGTTMSGSGFFIAKLNGTNGKWLWVYSSDNARFSIGDIIADGSNVYYSFSLLNISNFSRTGGVGKHTKDGAFVWQKPIPVVALSIAFKDNSLLYLGDVEGGDYDYSRLPSLGEVSLSTGTPTSIPLKKLAQGAASFSSYAMNTDAAGNLYVYGNCSAGTLTFDDHTLNLTADSSVIAKLDAQGDVAWTWAGPLLVDMGLNQSDEIIIAGSFKGALAICGNDPTGNPLEHGTFVAKLVPDTGNCAWVKKYPGIALSGSGSDNRLELVNGKIFIGGTFDETITLDGITLSPSDPTAEHTAYLGYMLESIYVGEPIPIPSTALGASPPLVIPQDSADAFLWSPQDSRYYATRPVNAELRWQVSEDPTVTTYARSYVDAVWPPNPQIHIVGAPVELRPITAPPGQDPATSHTYVDIPYRPSGATVENYIFRNSQAGYSTLLYAEGAEPDISRYPARLVIVRSVNWNDPGYLTEAEAVIGQKITDASHQDPTGKNGQVLFRLSRYDGAGQDGVYNFNTREGAIVPVNTDDPDSTSDDLVVVWYRQNVPTGVAWPVKPVRYYCRWPSNPLKIIIASELGSEVLGQQLLDPQIFVSAKVYDQPDPKLPGYKSNMEHALLLPSNMGTGFPALFALRAGKDQNEGQYVLLKYWDRKDTPVTSDDEWAYVVYRVTATEDGYTFTGKPGMAGDPILAPYPLSKLATCAESAAEGDATWVDYSGTVWARAAGHGAARYYYPLQEGFDYDLNHDGVQDEPVGKCVPWLRGQSDDPDQPIAVTYDVSWPSEAPSLRPGETLIKAKRFLPDIVNRSAVQVIYEGIDGEQDESEAASLVKLMDPLAERSVTLNAFPSDVAVVTKMGRTVPSGNKSGTIRLPYTLQSRVFYDPVTRKLCFKGTIDDPDADHPLLLPNIMTNTERKLLWSLNGDNGEAKDASAWDEAVDALYHLTRNPYELDLDEEPGPDRELMIGLDERNGRKVGRNLLGPGNVLSAGAARGTGWVTIAFNNDSSLASIGVDLKVFRVECDALGYPYQGDIHVIESDNIFDEEITLRYSGDFGGESDEMDFFWELYPGDGNPEIPPHENGFPVFPKPWETLAQGKGLPEVTIKGANERTLSNNRVVVAYKGLAACANDTSWSIWAGSPGGTPSNPEAQLAEGWINRVTKKLNPFDTRVQNFRESSASTYVSMIRQAGKRYSGPISLEPGASNLDSVGLIEAYETVFRKAMKLSIDAEESPVDYQPANDALLNLAGRISDLYMLLANEAYSDAADPTIGFGTASGEYGTAAPSIFAFQNQVGSLLDEELALLRGRDDMGTSISAAPVYNRIFWNFTRGEGEVAYSQVYEIENVNGDQAINEKDARIMYPQGHGDAWGHYLTALTTYYTLLRHPHYTWAPRSEWITVGDVPVEVDYFDERRFAHAAASRAKAGSEIVSLTYRQKYLDDPAGQWQGYKDSDPERSWGMDEWARRSGQSAYFDWVVANSILPPSDTAHTGIQKVDRTTVPELLNIASEFQSIQAEVDKADKGINPVGLAKGVVPFDIDPSLISQGQTHFEQIHERAMAALQNGLMVFNYANTNSQMLRKNQDTLEDFVSSVEDTEQDFRNRLIEIFGYPYAEDIGTGRTYPAKYEGADIYHHMYIDQTELTGEHAPVKVTKIETYFTPIPGIGFFPADPSANNPEGSKDIVKKITYNFSTEGFGLVKPEAWSSRKAPGELQRILSDLYQARARYQQAIKSWENLVAKINDQAELLEAQYDLHTHEIEELNTQANTVSDVNNALRGMELLKLANRRASWMIQEWSGAYAESLPKVVGLATDVTSFARGFIRSGALLTVGFLETTGDMIEALQFGLETGKEELQLQTSIELETANNKFEAQQSVKELEQLIREEPVLRMEVYTMKEAVIQIMGDYNAKLAEGERLLEDLAAFRMATAAEIQKYRYQDMAFRVFRNDALQKYRAQFDLAARYAYLAAAAYDYETNLLGSENGAGRQFFNDIVRQRSLGQVVDGTPVVGSQGLADSLARMAQNFKVFKSQLGFNNPQTETSRFSLRHELFRMRDESNEAWRSLLDQYRVDNLWNVPAFKRYCRPFAPEILGEQPGFVIPFTTTVTFGLNFFGNNLGSRDNSYDPTHFATKVRSVGVWFTGYDSAGLSNTPRVYLVPIGFDVLRSPTGDTFATREWAVMDQKLPIPFPIGSIQMHDPAYIPCNDALGGTLGEIRRFSSFRAHYDSGEFDPSETITDSRLIGRSVWNSQWLLIIPGGALLNDPNAGLKNFTENVTDIKLFFQTYAYSGN